MSRDLYIIVKEEDVRIVAEDTIGNLALKARSVHKEIEKIRQGSEHLDVNSSYELHPQMSFFPPSKNLKVWVCGGMKYACCSLQLYNLRKAGYNADYHPNACLDFLARLVEPQRLPGFSQLVPEYYVH